MSYLIILYLLHIITLISGNDPPLCVVAHPSRRRFRYGVWYRCLIYAVATNTSDQIRFTWFLAIRSYGTRRGPSQ